MTDLKPILEMGVTTGIIAVVLYYFVKGYPKQWADALDNNTKVISNLTSAIERWEVKQDVTSAMLTEVKQRLSEIESKQEINLTQICTVKYLVLEGLRDSQPKAEVEQKYAAIKDRVAEEIKGGKGHD